MALLLRRQLYCVAVTLGAATVAFAEPVPGWITKPPATPNQVCGIGSAQIEQQSQSALSVAAQRAKSEVLQVLRTSVRSSTSILNTQSKATDGQRTYADASQSVRQAATFDASVTNLPGLRVVETFTDQNQRESYALACLDTVQASNDIDLKLDEISVRLSMGVSYTELKNYKTKLAQIDDLRGFLGVWLSLSTAQRIDQIRNLFELKLFEARVQQTFWLSEPISTKYDVAVSTELTQNGFTASSRAPRYLVRVEAGPVMDSFEMGMYILRQSVSLSIRNSVTDQAKTKQVFCKGLGTQLNQALSKLQMQCGSEVTKAVQAILQP